MSSGNDRSKRLFGLFRSKSTKLDPISSNLGSGATLLLNSKASSFDPYSPPPNLQMRSRSKSVGREPNSRTTGSPPPLPTLKKFASAHDLQKNTKLQQESIQLMIHHLPSLDRSKSLSSKSIKDDDDIPLGYLPMKSSSLLSDKEEEDDHDLVPIANITMTTSSDCQSAADKYKERVKEKLKMEEDDDNIPFSLLKHNKK